MGIVLVGEVMQVDHLRAGGEEDSREIFHQRGRRRGLRFGARIPELDLAGVFAHERGLALFRDAHLFHALVGVIGVDAGARAAGAIGGHHAGEPPAGAAETLGDTVVRHDFDIVLVGRNAQVGGAREGGGGFHAVGNEDVGGGLVKLHGDSPVCR